MWIECSAQKWWCQLKHAGKTIVLSTEPHNSFPPCDFLIPPVSARNSSRPFNKGCSRPRLLKTSRFFSRFHLGKLDHVNLAQWSYWISQAEATERGVIRQERKCLWAVWIATQYRDNDGWPSISLPKATQPNLSLYNLSLLWVAIPLPESIVPENVI